MYPVRPRPPAGESPRAQDTPRTRQLKELRQKRLEYFESKPKDSADQSSDKKIHQDVRASMAADPRVAVHVGSIPGSAKVLHSKTSRKTIDVRNNNFVLPSTVTASHKKTPKSKDVNKTRKESPSFNNSTSVDDWESVFAASKDGSEAGKVSTGQSSRLSSARSSRPSIAHSSHSELPSRKTSKVTDIKKPEKGKLKTANIKTRKDDVVVVKKTKKDDVKKMESVPVLKIDNSSDDSSVGSPEGSMPTAPSNIFNHTSPRTFKNLLDPEYEEDYLGLSLSDQQQNLFITKKTLGPVAAPPLSSGSPTPHWSSRSSSFDNETTPKSSVVEDFESAKLESILGKDRFKRLLKNFEESDWALTSDESNVVTPRSLRSQGQKVNDLEIMSVRTDEEQAYEPEHAGASEETKIPMKTYFQADDCSDTTIEDLAQKCKKPIPAVSKSENFGSAEAYIRHVKDQVKVVLSAEMYGQTNGTDHGVNPLIASLSQSQQSSYRQWLASELTKPKDQTPTAELGTEVSGFTTSSIQIEPYFKQPVDSGSELVVAMVNTDVQEQCHSQPVASAHSPEPSHVMPAKQPSDRHVLGILQQLQKRELEKSELPEPLPPGLFSSPSLERYFSSLENISNGYVSSQDFDPIEEPDIEETPRDELTVQGQPAATVSRSPVPGKNSPKPKSNVKKPQKSKQSNPKSGKEPSKQQGQGKTFEVRMSMETVTTATEDTSVWGEESSGHTNIFLNRKTQSAVHASHSSDFSNSSCHATPVKLKSVNKSDSNSTASQSGVREDRDSHTKDSGLILEPSRPVYASVDNISSLLTEQGRVTCPDCGEFNKDYLQWCLECGAELHSSDPVDAKSSVSPDQTVEPAKLESSQSVQSETSEGLVPPTKPSAQSKTMGALESLQKDLHRLATQVKTAGSSEYNRESKTEKTADLRASLSLQAAAVNAEESFRSRMEHHFRQIPQDDEVPDDSVPWLSDDEDNQGSIKKGCGTAGNEDKALGDSHYFEYVDKDRATSRLSMSLQRELSLDLGGSLSRSQGGFNAEVSPEQKRLVEISENIDFEYENSISPSKSLPPDLAEELSLDLAGCLEQSMPASAFKKRQEELEEHVPGPSGDAVKAHSNEAPSNIVNGIPNDDNPIEANDDGPIDDVMSDDDVADADVPLIQNAAGNNDMEYDDIPIDDGEEEFDEGYQIFLHKLREDPRFRPRSAVSPPVPSASNRGRPRSACNARSRLSQSVSSKVKVSWEAEARPRRWEKSSVAWSSYSAGELKPRSSIYSIPLRSRGSQSRSMPSRPTSARARPSSAPRPASNRASELRASSAGRLRSSIRNDGKVEVILSDQSPRSSRDMLKVGSAPMATETKGPRKQALGTYDKLLALSPRVLGGELSYWLCLPDEIWLQVLSYLSHKDLSRCARTCKQLLRITMDDSLWRSVCVKKQALCDDRLVSIGKHRPACLAFIKCQGDRVTDAGLRELFRMAADSLEEFNFTGCSRGMLTGDHILLHAASRCRHICQLDASWCNVTDNGLMAISDASDRLEVVCVNGCQALTDDAIHALVLKHGIYLRELEMFGCFNLTARTVSSIVNGCKGLTSLNLGQCWKLTDVSLVQLLSSSSLSQLSSLDIRGCKQLKDNAIHVLLRNCTDLKTLSIANCPLITDVSLNELANQAQSLRSLDINGCKKLTVTGLRALLLGCTLLEFLDLSSTRANHKTVSQVASYCHRELQVIKINFCKDVTASSLTRLVKNCSRLRKLYLYGISGLRNVEELRLLNPDLWIEK